MEGFRYLRVLFTSERKVEREIDRWIVCSDVVVVSVRPFPKVDLHSYPHGHELWDEMADTSG